jgi:peptide/nickel transport system permease protein
VARYLARRLATLVGIVIVISIGAFYLIHLLPGDPAAVILGTGDSPENRAKLFAQLGLNRPIIEQYFVWVRNVLHGNLGISFISQVPVWSTIRGAIPIDFEMILISQIISFAIAIPLAMSSARRPDTWIDRFLGAFSFTMLSIPSFILVVVLVLVVAIKFAVPHTGVSSYVPFTQDWVVNLESMALPSIVLAVGSVTVYYRVLRSDLIATLQQEFITLARSKGLSQRRILWRHALRPSSVTLLGTAGVNIGGLLAGGFIVQYLLDIPGLGYTLINAIGLSDYLVVQGIVLVVSVGVIVINFLFDFFVNVVDPRIGRE